MKNKKRAQGASYLLDHGGYLLIYGSCQCYVCYFPQPRKPCGVQRLIEDWLLDWSRNFLHILQSIPIFPTPNLVCSKIPPPSFAFRSSKENPPCVTTDLAAATRFSLDPRHRAITI